MAAHLSASNSKQLTEGGCGILSDNAAIISPSWLRITTPKPASPESLNMAPSKFVLKPFKSGGFHLISFARVCCFGVFLGGWWSVSYLFDSLVVEGAHIDWAIHTMISNILDLSKLFSSCKFCLVRMLFNSAAHASAKLAVSLGSSFCCNKCNVPTFISNACQFDCSFVGLCLVNERCALSTHQKKGGEKKKEYYIIW